MSNLINGENFDSYVTGCLIAPKDGDREKLLFSVAADGVRARLKGYAIIPLEEYCRLTGQQLPEIPDCCPSE
jgi:hypothetical protein